MTVGGGGPVLVEASGDAAGEDALALGRRLAALLGVEARPVDDRPPGPFGLPGSLARGLHAAAERTGAAVVVVGSDHDAEPGHVLAGGTADRLLSGAPCPVALAPRGYARTAPEALARVAVAFAPEPEGHAALGLGHRLAAAAGAGLEVIEVFNPSVNLRTPQAALYGMPEFVAELREAARLRLHAAVDGLGRSVQVTLTFVEGEPPEELIRASGRLDLLVLGSRGYGPVRAALLGGVSRHVVRRAACPVVVVPRPGHEPAAGDAGGALAAGA